MTGSHAPDAGGRHGRRAARGQKRKRSRKGRIALICGAVAVALIAGVGAIYLKLNGNIQTFDGQGVSKHRPPDTAGENVLLIGSDTRANGNDALGGEKGGVAHSDTTILLHVYADHKHAIGVSIPRDSLVDIPPCRLPDGRWTPDQPSAMFNSAFTMGNSEQGNPACTQNTVEKLTGLRIDHTMVVDFKGFSSMTSAVGGVDVCLPKDIYQGDLNPKLPYRGKLIFHKGMQKVSGQKALDYVRLRHGIGDGSDIGRMRRQQAFLSQLIKKVQGKGFSPTTLWPLANAATKSLTVDPGLGTPQKLMSFAMSLKGVNLKNIKFLSAPWRYDGERVALVHPDVDTLWSLLKNDRTINGIDASGHKKSAHPSPSGSPSPSAVSVNGTGISVAVYNGTTTPGLATKAAAMLRGDAFTVTGTATASTQDHTTTLIEYGAAHLQGAQALAKLFPGSQLQQTATLGINLVLGQDYATGATSPSPTPSKLPTSDTQQARSASDGACSNVSYG
jgi:LCP family protein required for cell wall assembly